MGSSSEKRYPLELKESIARRYLTTEVSYRVLADEIGASAWSVRQWVQNLKETGTVTKDLKKRTTDSRTATEKFRLLLEAQALPEDERGAFLRREGLRDGDLERWQQEALSGLGATEPPGSSRRVRELERKMIKTEKRLREATALLDLQKKVQALWGDADDDTQGS